MIQQQQPQHLFDRIKSCLVCLFPFLSRKIMDDEDKNILIAANYSNHNSNHFNSSLSSSPTTSNTDNSIHKRLRPSCEQQEDGFRVQSQINQLQKKHEHGKYIVSLTSSSSLNYENGDQDYFVHYNTQSPSSSSPPPPSSKPIPCPTRNNNTNNTNFTCSPTNNWNNNDDDDLYEREVAYYNRATWIMYDRIMYFRKMKMVEEGESEIRNYDGESLGCVHECNNNSRSNSSNNIVDECDSKNKNKNRQSSLKMTKMKKKATNEVTVIPQQQEKQQQLIHNKTPKKKNKIHPLLLDNSRSSSSSLGDVLTYTCGPTHHNNDNNGTTTTVVTNTTSGSVTFMSDNSAFKCSNTTMTTSLAPTPAATSVTDAFDEGKVLFHLEI